MTRAPFPGSPLAGSGLMTGLNSRFKQLYDAASFPLSDVGGTANAVTATLVPALDGDGLLDGMMFHITWDAANTGGMTLAINGGSALPMLGFDGMALPAGSVGAGLRSVVAYYAGEFLLVSPSLLMGAAAGVGSFYWTFTTSGTWTKPDGLLDNQMTFVEAWGGGGGGHTSLNGGGGGGGAWIGQWFRVVDLPSSVTVTVGAGGVAGAAGGNTTFGTLLTAFAGGFGSGDGASSRRGGGGGGTGAAGTAASASMDGAGGFQGGGAGGSDASTENGGGGGGSTAGVSGLIGGRAYRGGGGGGGGAGGGGTAGGTSLYGGNGGAGGSAGVAPGGGGGVNASGARGELRVWIP